MNIHQENEVEYVLEQFYHEERNNQRHAIVRATAKGKIQMIDLIQPKNQEEDGVWIIQTITDVPQL